jgi:hypothetical protein
MLGILEGSVATKSDGVGVSVAEGVFVVLQPTTRDAVSTAILPARRIQKAPLPPIATVRGFDRGLRNVIRECPSMSPQVGGLGQHMIHVASG